MLDALIVRLAMALSIGLLVGLERGWRGRDVPPGERAAGIRTYGLCGLLGGVLAALADRGGPAIFGFGFLGFAAVFGWFSWQEQRRAGNVSATSAVAALSTFAIGGLAVAGDYRTAGAAGVALAALLASRDPLHRLVEKLTWIELRSVLLLAGMTAIVLPLLPNRTIDPWGGVNPREIWIFTLITSALSYGGYIAIRLFGPRTGVLISGLLGAIVSSTAVTIAFARRAKAGEPARPLAAGAALASMVSLLRVLSLVAFIKPQLALSIAAPTLAAALTTGSIGAGLLWKSALSDSETRPKLGNPFDVGTLLIFAAGFAIVAALSAALTQSYGSTGLVLTSGLSGIADVDVAALTAARLAGGSVPVPEAAKAVFLALSLNAAMRVAGATALGSAKYSLVLLAAALSALLSGMLVLAIA